MRDDASTAGGHDRRHDQAPDSPAARMGSCALARAADMIERQSAEDRKWAFLSERTDFQEVAAE
ncbi:MAG TPA: hypothetical protein VNB91_11390 [Jatrophihabitantaceae bacterium]|nr:hypothetical protein [Jatrophihabitantaceae bacterium]